MPETKARARGLSKVMRGYCVLVLIAAMVAGPMCLAQSDAANSTQSSLPALPTTDYKPKFRGDPARSDDEALALGYLRTVVDAQRQYKKKKNKYASSLQALVGSGSFTKRMLKTDRGAYTASFTGNTQGKKYSLQMIPKQFDAAHRAFFVNESGTIRAEAEQPASQESAVLRADR